MATNFVKETVGDSAAPTKLFFDTYGISPLEFNSIDFDSTVVFFQSKGFDQDAAIITASTLLKQAKLDNIAVQRLLDSLKGFTEIQISALVGEILNNNRSPISVLGYRIRDNRSDLITRNIVV